MSKLSQYFCKVLYLGDDGDVLGVTLPGRGVLCVRVCRARGRGGGGAHQVAGVLVQGRQLGGLCRQVISFLIVVEESYVKYLIMRTYLF